jgi:hypothetical protein
MLLAYNQHQRICTFTVYVKLFSLFNMQFTVGMHSVNAVLLLGETSLNCMVSLFFPPFPYISP